MKRVVINISDDWKQSTTLMTDLQRRPTFGNGLIGALLDLQKKNTISYIKLDLVSKVVGKAVYSVDSLSRN
jgi:hypothetical protein